MVDVHHRRASDSVKEEAITQQTLLGLDGDIDNPSIHIGAGEGHWDTAENVGVFRKHSGRKSGMCSLKIHFLGRCHQCDFSGGFGTHLQVLLQGDEENLTPPCVRVK